VKSSVKIFIGIILLGICFIVLSKYRADIKYQAGRFLETDKDAAEEMQIIGSSKKPNPRVKELQENLFKMGYGSGAVDGLMGKSTREAIKKFQREKRLAPTGRVNKKTFLELQRKVLKNSTLSTKVLKPKKIVIDGKISPSSVKEKVKEIQRMLKSLGAYHGKIDGIMGKETINAIRSVEKSSVAPSLWQKTKPQESQKKK